MVTLVLPLNVHSCKKNSVKKTFQEQTETQSQSTPQCGFLHLFCFTCFVHGETIQFGEGLESFLAEERIVLRQMHLWFKLHFKLHLVIVLVSWGCHTNDNKLGGLKPNVFSHSSGDQKSKIKVLAGPVPSGGFGEHPSLPLPASGDSRSPLACGCITLISVSFTWLCLLCPVFSPSLLLQGQLFSLIGTS